MNQDQQIIERQAETIRDLTQEIESMKRLAFLELESLRAFNQKLRRIVPQPPNAITWEQGVEILNVVQNTIWNQRCDSPELEKEHQRAKAWCLENLRSIDRS